MKTIIAAWDQVLKRNEIKEPQFVLFPDIELIKEVITLTKEPKEKIWETLKEQGRLKNYGSGWMLQNPGKGILSKWVKQ